MRHAARTEVSVLGGGNWGTTVAQIIAANGHPVTLWCRSAGQAAEINEHHTNARYLEGISLSPKIRATTVLEEAVKGVPTLFFVIPSKSFRSVCQQAAPLLTPDQYLIHATKGMEAGSHKRMSEIILEETCIRQFGVLSGPNIALEICQGKPAGTVVASHFPRVVERASQLLHSPLLRVYSNDDVLGVELAGTLKNVVAIAAGMVSELKLGENTKALLVTRGLSEIGRLGTALGARPMTFAGLAGIGDLMVTCASPLSRNHRVGAALARGKKLEEIVVSLGMVAEGVNTAKVAHEIAVARGIDAPLFEAIYRVLHEGLPPATAMQQLLVLSSRHDIDRALEPRRDS